MDAAILTALSGFGADITAGIAAVVPIALGVVATLLVFQLAVRWIRGATR